MIKMVTKVLQLDLIKNAFWFMMISLSNLVDNLAERIHKNKFKYCGCFL